MNEQHRVEFLSFNTIWPFGKKHVMDKRIAGIEREGWAFERAEAVSFFKSIRHLGGALNLHFKRTSN